MSLAPGGPILGGPGFTSFGMRILSGGAAVGNIHESFPPAELPGTVLAHQFVFVMAALRDGRFFIRPRRDIPPAGPCGRGVAVHVDDEVREQMVRAGGLA